MFTMKFKTQTEKASSWHWVDNFENECKRNATENIERQHLRKFQSKNNIEKELRQSIRIKEHTWSIRSQCEIKKKSDMFVFSCSTIIK